MLTVKQRDDCGLWSAGLALLVLGLLGLGGGATHAVQRPSLHRSGQQYTVRLLAPEAILQYQPADVIVQVQTPLGPAVDDIPVEFRLDPGATRYARLFPHRTTTKRGRARAVLQARSVGIVQVTAQVGAITTQADIPVMMPVARSVWTKAGCTAVALVRLWEAVQR